MEKINLEKQNSKSNSIKEISKSNSHRIENFQPEEEKKTEPEKDDLAISNSQKKETKEIQQLLTIKNH